MYQKLLLKDYKNNKGFVTFDERLNYVIFQMIILKTYQTGSLVKIIWL